MINVGIIGGTGIVAGELIRCLLNHQDVNIDFVYSHSQPGKKVSAIHQDLEEVCDFVFTDKVNVDADAIFLCLGHGNSKKFLESYTLSSKTKVIDLSNDFRLQKDANWQGENFIYGLIELNKDIIPAARLVANPGCFATAIQLAILPLAKEGLLKNEVHVNAITGSTGAGNALLDTTHFTWRNNNISIYKAFKHQHLGEINQSVRQLQNASAKEINFIPVRGNFTRGIFASIYTTFSGNSHDAYELYQTFYANSPFTAVSESAIHLKQVVNTNRALLHVEVIDNKILITSAIDNLLKGAAGQAIENLNLLFGFEPQSGLRLKANYY